MRSPTGPILVILGLATTLVLVLVLFQAIGLRGDLEALRDDAAELRAEVAALAQVEPEVTRDELERQLGILESGIRDWLIATGADGFDPDATPGSGGQGGDEEVLDRLDLVLQRIEALDSRLDEICEGVPVC
jgi:hypothetical protein